MDCFAVANGRGSRREDKEQEEPVPGSQRSCSSRLRWRGSLSCAIGPLLDLNYHCILHVSKLFS